MRPSQPVTAWTLVVTTTDKDGSIHRSTETIDAYLSEVPKEFAGQPRQVDRLDARSDPREIRARIRRALAPSPKSPLSSWRMARRSATTKPLPRWFEHRAKQRDELREVVNVFDGVLPKARGTTALEQLEAGITPSRRLTGNQVRTSRLAKPSTPTCSVLLPRQCRIDRSTAPQVRRYRQTRV